MENQKEKKMWSVVMMTSINIKTLRGAMFFLSLACIFSQYAWSSCAARNDVMAGTESMNINERLLEKASTDSEIISLSLCAYDSGNYSAAIVGFTEAINRKIKFPIFHYRGLSNFAAGNLLDAIDDLKISINSGYGGGQDYVVLSEIYWALGRKKDSIGILEEAVKVYGYYESRGKGYFDPTGERVILDLTNKYFLMGEKKQGINILINGFEGNQLSIGIFDKLIESLLEEGDVSVANYYKKKHCGSPVISEAMSCKIF